MTPSAGRGVARIDVRPKEAIVAIDMLVTTCPAASTR